MAHLVTKIAEYGIIFKNNKILMLRFAKETNSGEKWIFPGGRVDEGEKPVEGLGREIIEEIGLDVIVRFPCAVTMWGEGEDHRYAVFFICDYKDGNVSLSHEHQDFKWLTEEEIESIEHHNDNFKSVLRDAFSIYKRINVA